MHFNKLKIQFVCSVILLPGELILRYILKLRYFSLPLIMVISIGCSPAEKKPERRNVILITIDALRADGLSLYGNQYQTSPFIDQLVRKEGVYFNLVLAPYICTPPSMASLMTGLHPYFRDGDGWEKNTFYGLSRFRREGEPEGMTSSVKTLAEILGDAGYITIGFNTNPLLLANTNFSQGFNEYINFEDYFKEAEELRVPLAYSCSAPASVVTRKVIERIYSIEEPFFLWIHLMDVHFPYLPPEPYNRMYDWGFIDGDDLTLLKTFQALILKQQNEDSFREFKTLEELGVTREELTNHMKGLYHGEIRRVDDYIKKLYEYLKDHGLMENTLLIITSDHGEEFLEHGYISHHGRTGGKAEMLNIPLIMVFPDDDQIDPGRNIEDQIGLVDLAPTILEYLGLTDAASSMEGESFLPVIRDRNPQSRIGYVSGLGFETVVADSWKYIRFKSSGREELFNLKTDPGEKKNIASEYSDKTQELRELYRRFCQKREEAVPLLPLSESAGESPNTLFDPATRERLRALGYAQ